MDIYVVADTQIRPGVRNPLVPVAWDIINTLPDHVVHLGDHHDFPSLSIYDLGKHSFNDRCYIKDINAGNKAFEEFWTIIYFGQEMNPEWECEFTFIEGNHENRRHKAKDTGPISYLRLLDEFAPDYEGWDYVMPFLEPRNIGGVNFVHYVANEFSGRAIGSAKAILSKKHKSAVVGHKQTLDYAEEPTLGGKRIMCLMIGACYFHDEEYKGPQSNNHFRGTALLRNVKCGEWELEVRNLKTLDKRCGV